VSVKVDSFGQAAEQNLKTGCLAGFVGFTVRLKRLLMGRGKRGVALGME